MEEPEDDDVQSGSGDGASEDDDDDDDDEDLRFGGGGGGDEEDDLSEGEYGPDGLPTDLPTLLRLCDEQKRSWLEDPEDEKVGGRPLKCRICNGLLILNPKAFMDHIHSKRHKYRLPFFKYYSSPSDPLFFASKVGPAEIDELPAEAVTTTKKKSIQSNDKEKNNGSRSDSEGEDDVMKQKDGEKKPKQPLTKEERLKLRAEEVEKKRLKKMMKKEAYEDRKREKAEMLEVRALVEVGDSDDDKDEDTKKSGPSTRREDRGLTRKQRKQVAATATVSKSDKDGPVKKKQKKSRACK